MLQRSNDTKLVENRVRGQAFRSIFDVLDEVGGPGTKDHTLSSLPPELADAYRYGALVVSGWFPIAWYRDLHVAIKQSMPGTQDIHKKLGRASTKRDIHGVYRFILQITSPTFLMNNVGRIAGTYVKECRHTVIARGLTHSRIQLQIPGATPEIWEDVAGSAEAILTACGARSPTVSVLAGTTDAVATIEAAWQQANASLLPR